ncbi:MAG: DUF4177 domain-containing protein [Bacteroidetes bacterium]|nr:MAG: DUF4177 domain-containing protein [Bacteroidota bacterium]
MYEYKFINIKTEVTAFKGLKTEKNYQQVIEEHAKEGWRLVQVFAPSLEGFGHAGYFEVILERKKAS